MNVEICDICKNKESNKRFKVKMSRKGRYLFTDKCICWQNIWQPYKKISICSDCAEKLLGIKSEIATVDDLLKLVNAKPKQEN